MGRITVRGKGRNVYLTGYADVCWGGRSVGERAFCTGCHGDKDNRDVDRSKCGPLTAIDRLAAYEDIGLGPEDITNLMASHGTAILELSKYYSIGSIKHFKELSQAEKDGRLVVLEVLPQIRPGGPNRVYLIDDNEIYDDDVVCVTIGMGSDGEICCAYETFEGRGFYSSDMGKTVFLTQDEAEAALKKRE